MEKGTRKATRRKLLAEVTAFCKKTGISKTAFGIKAFGQPAFYGTLFKGRTVGDKVYKRAHEFMRSYKGGSDEA